MPRLLVLLALCVAFVSLPAQADTVLLACSDECSPALFEALELELRGHGGVLVGRPAPAGFTPSARSADAQRLNELLGAGATLWVEHEAPLRVRAYSAKSGQTHEAPLNAEVHTLEPKLFAAIAGSIALEALKAAAPPPPSPAAPGAAQLAADQPSVGPVASSAAADPGDLKARQRLDEWRPMRKPSAWSKRFFVRVGAAVGFAAIGRGASADRVPSASLVNAAAQAQADSGDLGIAKQYLFSRGFDCDARMTAAPDGSAGFVAKNCKVALRDEGIVTTAAMDIASGLNLTSRVALAWTLRIDPTVGRGALANTLVGLQTEVGLVLPNVTGFWLSAAAGLGAGQIQVHPTGGPGTPWARSGLGNARLGAMLGYRFLPRLGVVASPTVHLMFPDTLWVFETNLNLEVRI